MSEKRLEQHCNDPPEPNKKKGIEVGGNAKETEKATTAGSGQASVHKSATNASGPAGLGLQYESSSEDVSEESQ